MKTAIVTFSVMGAKLGKKIADIFIDFSDRETDENFDVDVVTTNERAAHIVQRLTVPLSNWVGEKFVICDLLIFVGACGIAVRKIAPFISDKKTDPAVLVVDDRGQNVISLLSGHLGGANEWAEFLAGKIGANPVITTASDCNGKIAVDMFAKKNKLVITDFKLAKEIESALLDGEKIGFYSELPIVGKVPDEFILIEDVLKNDEPKYSLRVGLHNKCDIEKTLQLIPECVVAGIGCKRGKTREEILSALGQCLEKADIPSEAVCKIASINLKSDEEGLLEAAEELKAEIEFYSAEELLTVDIVSESSEFVKEVTGVDNVCERAAIIGSERGRVLLEKRKSEGVTVALAMKERSISFE